MKLFYSDIMNGPSHRLWMYHRRNSGGLGLREGFKIGVDCFDEFSRSQHEFLVNGVYRCPCKLCKNTKYLHPETVKIHLYRKGFFLEYLYWTSHGEVEPQSHDEASTSAWGTNFEFNNSFDYDVPEDGCYEGHHMETMLNDVMGSNVGNMGEAPNASVESFYNMFQSAQQPL